MEIFSLSKAKPSEFSSLAMTDICSKTLDLPVRDLS